MTIVPELVIKVGEFYFFPGIGIIFVFHGLKWSYFIHWNRDVMIIWNNKSSQLISLISSNISPLWIWFHISISLYTYLLIIMFLLKRFVLFSKIIKKKQNNLLKFFDPLGHFISFLRCCITCRKWSK